MLRLMHHTAQPRFDVSSVFCNDTKSEHDSIPRDIVILERPRPHPRLIVMFG